MRDSEHRCPRCGGYLPTVTVWVPVYVDVVTYGAHPTPILARYEEREEAAECVRCTGAY